MESTTVSTTVNIPFTLIVSAIGLLISAITAMAIYIVSSHKSSKREAKENLTMMTNALISNSQSNTALSNSIDVTRSQQERISEQTSRLISSLTEKVIEIKNGKHN